MRKFISNIVWVKKVFLFALLHFSAKSCSLAFHVTPFPSTNFFTTRSEIKITLKKYLTANRCQNKNDFKKIRIWNFHLQFCKFNDLPDRKFSQNKNFYFLFLTFFRAVKWEWKFSEREVKMKICIHAFVISFLSERSFCSMQSYQVLNMLRMWWFLWVLTHHESIVKIMKWKVLKKEKFCRHDNVLGFHDFFYAKSHVCFHKIIRLWVVNKSLRCHSIPHHPRTWSLLLKISHKNIFNYFAWRTHPLSINITLK
jgi:hypothetical protein